MALPYLLEADEARPEVKVGTSGHVLSAWPRQAGNLVDAVSAAYAVRHRDGTAIASGAATVASVAYGTRTVSRLDVTLPALGTLDLDYVCEIAWVRSDGSIGTEIILFDVVRVPLGDLLSPNDLVEGYAQVEDILLSVADRMGVTGSDQVKAEAATSTYATGARVALQQLLEQRADADGQPRPAMMLERRKLVPVERHLALRDLFAAVARGPLDDVEDLDSGRYRWHAHEAARLFEQLRIAYDVNEDGVADATTNFGSLYRTARGQAR